MVKKPIQQIEDQEIDAEEQAIEQEEEQEMEIPKPQMQKPFLKAIPKVNVPEKTEEEKRIEQINAEINLLGSNNGFYRRQLLIQLTELNASIGEISGVLQFLKKSLE